VACNGGAEKEKGTKKEKGDIANSSGVLDNLTKMPLACFR
jgi:hypothetical protein